MSTTFGADLADLVIVTGSQVSRVVDGDLETSDAVGIALIGPATLPDTVTIQCSADAAFTTPCAVMEGSPLAAVTAPGAAEGRTYFTLPLHRYWRLKAAANVAADRTFKFRKTFRA